MGPHQAEQHSRDRGSQKEERERDKGPENLLEKIMAENFPNLGKETDFQVQEAQRVLNKTNLRRSTPNTLQLK